jgi:hypothetical protein
LPMHLKGRNYVRRLSSVGLSIWDWRERRSEKKIRKEVSGANLSKEGRDPFRSNQQQRTRGKKSLPNNHLFRFLWHHDGRWMANIII